MDKINLSIIIPFYNRINELKKCLNSIQEEMVYEILLIDDKSNFRAELIELNLHYPEMKIIHLDENVGGASARNLGIKEAKGEWLAFLDADDCWIENKVKKQIQHLSNHEPNENLVSFCRIRVSLNGNFYIKPKNSVIEIKSVKDYLFIDNGLIQTSGIVCRTKLAQMVLFEDKLRKHQDVDFCIRLEEYGAKFLFLDEVLVEYLGDEDVQKVSHHSSNLSLTWLKKNEEKLNKKQKVGFLKFFVGYQYSREGQLIKAIGVEFNGYKYGLIGPKTFLKNTASAVKHKLNVMKNRHFIKSN